MKQFINTRETLVTEAIDGTLRTAGGRLGEDCLSPPGVGR